MSTQTYLEPISNAEELVVVISKYKTDYFSHC